MEPIPRVPYPASKVREARLVFSIDGIVAHLCYYYKKGSLGGGRQIFVRLIYWTFLDRKVSKRVQKWTKPVEILPFWREN
jgi:hypothetical protein